MIVRVFVHQKLVLHSVGQGFAQLLHGRSRTGVLFVAKIALAAGKIVGVCELGRALILLGLLALLLLLLLLDVRVVFVGRGR